ncbi:hypothetical protein BGW41_001919 [Actinomortierella wolfii]|nr:hypothetical protein BGW41_001919 [Actinomortierella wolfii]
MEELTRPRPIDIVELTEMIALHLQPSDRARCLRVSKSWYQAILPLLYSEVKLDDRVLDRILRYPSYLLAVERYSHLVRHVDQPLLFGSVGAAAALDNLRTIVADRCTQLRELSYYESNSPLSGTKPLMRLLAHNASTLLKLSITLRGTFNSQQIAACFAVCPEPVPRLRREPLQSFVEFTRLESLTLTLEGYPSFYLLAFILQRCPRLLHLELQKWSGSELTILPQDFNQAVSTSQEGLTFRLHSLTIEQPGQCSAIPLLIQCCPSLKSLVLPPFPENLLTDLCSVLSRCSLKASSEPLTLPALPLSSLTHTKVDSSATGIPAIFRASQHAQKITSLTLAMSEKFTDEYLEAVLCCFPSNQLQHLDFVHTGAGGRTMSVILEAQLASLETLRLVSSLNGITNDHVLTLLTKGTRLRVIELMAEIRHTTHLYVEDLIQQPWQCLDLEVFCIGIHGVCDPTLRQMRENELRYDHFRKLQYRALEQLKQELSFLQPRRDGGLSEEEKEKEKEGSGSSQKLLEDMEEIIRSLQHTPGRGEAQDLQQDEKYIQLVQENLHRIQRISRQLQELQLTGGKHKTASTPDPLSLFLLSLSELCPDGHNDAPLPPIKRLVRLMKGMVNRNQFNRTREQLVEDRAVWRGCMSYQLEIESRFYIQLGQLRRLRTISTWCQGCARVTDKKSISNLLSWELQLLMPKKMRSFETEDSFNNNLYDGNDDDDDDDDEEEEEEGKEEKDDCENNVDKNLSQKNGRRKRSKSQLVFPGIEAMSTLSRLQVFKPGFVRRHVTQAELQWMKQHWEKLDQLAYKVVIPPTVLPPKHWLVTHWPTLKFYPSHCV